MVTNTGERTACWKVSRRSALQALAVVLASPAAAVLTTSEAEALAGIHIRSKLLPNSTFEQNLNQALSTLTQAARDLQEVTKGTRLMIVVSGNLLNDYLSRPPKDLIGLTNGLQA